MEHDKSDMPIKLQRRLAVILYADVVGYSRLMEKHEAETFHLLSNSIHLITDIIKERGGKPVKFAGDALLAEFSSAVEALSCAVDLQKASDTWNVDLTPERHLVYRVGLNLGDVIVSHEDLFGDAVNVAARLESMADPGGICISGTVFDQVRNKMALGFEYVGEETVKNISEPVRVYRVAVDSDDARPMVYTRRPRRKRHWWLVSATAVAFMSVLGLTLVWKGFVPSFNTDGINTYVPKLPAKPSIAVLPFTNVSGDPSKDYFSDGLTNDIISDLSKFRALFVIASNTAFTFKGKPVSVRDVGQQLGVRYVLEGTVQRADRKIRVNAQLIDATSDYHVWAERLVRDEKELFDLQDELVGAIVATLAINVDRAERKRAMRKRTASLEAYDYVLRGRENRDLTTSSANFKARELFRHAIEIDPRLVEAYVGLGECYLDALRFGWSGTPGQALQQAHDLAQKALALEEQSAGAHRLLGFAYLKWTKYDLAKREFERALELNPNDSESHGALGGVWLYTGRKDAAIESLETARRSNPYLHPNDLIHLSLAYYLDARYDDAVQTLEPALGRNPNLVVLRVILAAAYAQLNRLDEARQTAAIVRRQNPFFSIKLFGNQLKNKSDRQHVKQGLRMAGLR